MTERRRPGGALSGPDGEGTALTGSMPTDARIPGRLPRPLACCLAVLSLSGCGATVDGSAVPALWGAGAAVVLAGGSAYVARRATARPLLRARDQAERNLNALLEERQGLAAERETQERRLSAYAGERQSLLQEREQLTAALDELTRHADEGAEMLAAATVRGTELAAERDALTATRDALVLERDALAKERDELEGSVDSTFVNLAMRTLTLVERQLVLIEALEGRETDPAQLESLFRLDHLATRMRRNSENMLLLAGLENSHRSRKTVALLDVVRAAVSEIERYERVRLGFLASIRLGGAVADDTSHLVAELLENATAFSPPQDQVEVGGWLLDNGELMISVVDRGIGLPGERLRALNEQLSEPAEPGDDRRDALLAGALTGRSMGLFVVARLARRHGIRVQLRENVQGGGVTAMVMLPREALQLDSAGTDLDDQRRAERSLTSAAESARAQAEAAAAAQPRPPAAAPPAGAATDGGLPVLPRRKPAGQPGPAAPVAADPAAEPAGVDGAVAAPERTGEPDRRHDRADERIPAQQRGDSPAREHAPLPEGADVTPLGLPRRVPRGNGLPGTGETPTSGLRRLAVEESAPARTAPGQPARAAEPVQPQQPEQPQQPAPALPSRSRPGADTSGTSGTSGTEQHAPARSGVSPEELRRRLGVFQGGLRRAARDSALGGAGRPGPARPTEDHLTEERPTEDRTAASPTTTSPTAGPHPSADRPTTARPTVAAPTDRPDAPTDRPHDPAAEGENR